MSPAPVVSRALPSPIDSMAMALPISTPPNAIAYSAGSFTTKQMVVSGSIIAVIGMGLTYLFLPTLLKVAGLG